MRRAELPLPEIALIAVTRGMLGAGLGILLSSRMSREKRRIVGWPLVAIGALSTVPLVLDVARRTRSAKPSAIPPSSSALR